MKNILIYACCAWGLLFSVGCQNELYKDADEDFQAPQGAYVLNKSAISLFAEEGKAVTNRELTLALTKVQDEAVMLSVRPGTQEQLDAYNTANGTSYIMLPTEMYELEGEVQVAPGATRVLVPIHIKDTYKSDVAGAYALPLKLADARGASVIGKENEAILLVENRTITKALRMNGVSMANGLSSEVDDPSKKNTFLSPELHLGQWTVEVMIQMNMDRSRAFLGGGGSKGGSGDEIYGRLHRRNADPDNTASLEFKTASTVLGAVLPLKKGEWLMLSIVYDGTGHKIYANGELLLDQKTRTGTYGLLGAGLWEGNQWVREFRWWDVARTQAQIKDNVWKTVNPTHPNLFLYFPLNGKRRDFETGVITEDETRAWDWSRNARHIELRGGAAFRNADNGEPFVFPKP